MAKVSTYLNFVDKTEAVFNFYRTVFGTEFVEPGFRRFSQIPPMEGMPPMDEQTQNLIMHVELPITGGHILMGTDAPAQMGFTVIQGNNVHISLHPDSKEEADALFNSLSAGGKVTMPIQDMFWGDYFGSCTDQYGVNWMINFSSTH